MMRLYQSLLDNEEDLIKTSEKATNPFNLLGVKKIWVMGPAEPTNDDIPSMMDFLNYIDWNKIKKEHLDIKFDKFPGPVYNGFTKKYREQINIVAYLICKIAAVNGFTDLFEIKKEFKKYVLPNYTLKYNLNVKYYRTFFKSKPVRQLGLYFEGKNGGYKGLEIIIDK